MCAGVLSLSYLSDFQVDIPHDVYQNKRTLSTLRSMYDGGKKKNWGCPSDLVCQN